MTNPSLMNARQESKTLDRGHEGHKGFWLSPDYDDDDDADEDDADDETLQGPWRGQHWLSRSEFGSPEWWTQA